MVTWKRFPERQHNIQVKWIPSHLSASQWVQRGGMLRDWEGNDRADKEAKLAARTIEPSARLVQLRRQQLEKEKVAMHTIAEIQCRVLSGRVRLKHADVATKARKRKAPAMPAALKDRPKKARLTKMVVDKPEDKEVQDFAWNGMRRFLTAEQAAELVLRPMGVAPEGCHQLECAEGPYNECGTWEKPKSGGVKWFMECVKCGKKAGDSSRWGALMRTACGAPVLGWNEERHVMENMVDSNLHECRRCGLHSGGEPQR